MPRVGQGLAHASMVCGEDLHESRGRRGELRKRALGGLARSPDLHRPRERRGLGLGWLVRNEGLEVPCVWRGLRHALV
jgi:hypothetical protein